MTPSATITHVTTKQDMARFARAHADAPAITWSVQAGPGGTMIITEHGKARSEAVPVRETARAWA